MEKTNRHYSTWFWIIFWALFFGVGGIVLSGHAQLPLWLLWLRGL